MWQPEVLKTYGNQTTSYVNKIPTPMRLRYPNTMGEEELFNVYSKTGYKTLQDVPHGLLQGKEGGKLYNSLSQGKFFLRGKLEP